jgi:hypothetical protein
VVLKNRYSTTISEENTNKQNDNSNSGEPKTKTPESEAQKRKARLVSVMIGSAVAFLGSSYVLYNKLTKAKAEGATDIRKENLDESNNENLKDDAIDGGKDDQDGTDVKKKKRKGFRARRVSNAANLQGYF